MYTAKKPKQYLYVKCALQSSLNYLFCPASQRVNQIQFYSRFFTQRFLKSFKNKYNVPLLFIKEPSGSRFSKVMLKIKILNVYYNSWEAVWFSRIAEQLPLKRLLLLMKLLNKNLKGSKTHEKMMSYFVWLICQKAITVRPR